MLQIKVAFPPAWGQDPAGAEYMYSRYIIVIYKKKIDMAKINKTLLPR